MAVRVEALRRARAEVRAAIQLEGKIKLSAVPAREITAQAEAYILAHCELIVEARAKVGRWRVEGFLERLHELESYDQRGKACDARLLLNETHAQNGAVG